MDNSLHMKTCEYGTGPVRIENGHANGEIVCESRYF